MHDVTMGPTLVADIGGTNTRAALADGPDVRKDTIRRFTNDRFEGPADVLAHYLTTQGDPACAGACVAVAGPVLEGRGRLTNRPWTLDETQLGRLTGAAQVAIVNDLQAQGHALDLLDPEAIRPVIPTRGRVPEGIRLVIGLGTGFNAVVVVRNGNDTLVPASETGQISLPVRCEQDLRLLQSAITDEVFPSVETFLSGDGLARVRAFVASEAGSEVQMTAAQTIEAAKTGDDPLSEDAIDTFLRLLGRVAGDLALIHVPVGGIYLVGGVCQHLAPWLDGPTFSGAFLDKGRFRGFMEQFAVWLVDDDAAALTGAAAYLASRAAQP